MTAREQVQAMLAEVIVSRPFDVEVSPSQIMELEVWAFALKDSGRPVDELTAAESVAMQVFLQMHERAKFLNEVMSEAERLIRSDGPAESPPEAPC